MSAEEDAEVLTGLAGLERELAEKWGLARFIQKGRDDDPTAPLTFSVGGNSLAVSTETARQFQRFLIDDSNWLRRAIKDLRTTVQKLRPDLLKEEN